MSLTTPAFPLAGQRELVKTSCQLAIRYQAPSGAFPASPAYAVYKFCWLRDGSFTAEGLSRHGHRGAAEAFHRWCARLMGGRAAQVEEVAALASRGQPVPASLLLPARYTFDGQDSQEPWWEFQLDGPGTWLWALGAHLNRNGMDAAAYRDAIATAVRYLTCLWEQPCYDWWEEHTEHRHVSTLAAIEAGLSAALRLGTLDDALAGAAAAVITGIRATVSTRGQRDGHLVKWLDGADVDGSLLACLAPFATASGAAQSLTLAAVERDLARDHGVYRYLADTFYGGGRWPVLAGFLGLAYARAGRVPEARAVLSWIASTANSGGELPEQVGPLLRPDREAEWISRWGSVATPLLWSHGMYLMLADAVGVHA
jgi:GH15 family glucan-1,4-alpha-glucosidase